MNIHQFAKAINRSVPHAKLLARKWQVGEIRNGKLRFYPSEARPLPHRVHKDRQEASRSAFAAQLEEQTLRSLIAQAPAPLPSFSDPTIVQDSD